MRPAAGSTTPRSSGDLLRLYVAHTANDAVDVIDLDRQVHIGSIDGLTGVAGALVDEATGLVFTSNLGEDTVGILHAADSAPAGQVSVGVRPNGLAFDPMRKVLLAANVGDPTRPETHTLSVVDVLGPKLIASIPVAGRTRWTIYDPTTDSFFVTEAGSTILRWADTPAYNSEHWAMCWALDSRPIGDSAPHREVQMAFLYLHVIAMFAGVSVAAGSSLLLLVAARRRELEAVRAITGMPIGRVIPALYVSGGLLGLATAMSFGFNLLARSSARLEETCDHDERNHGAGKTERGSLANRSPAPE